MHVLWLWTKRKKLNKHFVFQLGKSEQVWDTFNAAAATKTKSHVFHRLAKEFFEHRLQVLRRVIFLNARWLVKRLHAHAEAICDVRRAKEHCRAAYFSRRLKDTNTTSSLFARSPAEQKLKTTLCTKKRKKNNQISSRYGRSNKMLQVALSPTGCLKMGVPSATGHVVFRQFCGTPCSSAIFDQHPLANENEAPNVTNAVSRRIVSFWPKSTGRQHIDRSSPAVAKEGDSKRLRKVTTRE